MKFSIIFIISLISSISFSQNKISGIVTNSDGETVTFIPVGLLLLPDSVVIKGVLTDETGNYTFENINSGDYLVSIKSGEYQEKSIGDIKFDSISFKELKVDFLVQFSAQTIDEFSVVALKKTVKFENGNIVVNVENSVLAKGNSVFELLAKLPTVSVYDNKIAILGKQGTIVMIDGRAQVLSDEQLINLLKSMSADLVASIEVLKNPPVKYDASGSAGMINIKTKKVKLYGTTGTVFSSYSQGVYENLMSGFSLNHKTKKFTFFSSLSGDYGHYTSVQDLNKGFLTDSSSTNLISKITEMDFEQTLNYRFGMDWNVSKKDIVGLKFEGGPGVESFTTNSKILVIGNNYMGFDHLNCVINQPEKWNSSTVELNYNHQIDSVGSSFSVVSNFTNTTDQLSSLSDNRFLDESEVVVLPSNIYRGKSHSNSLIYTSVADFTKNIDTTSTISFGSKISFVKTVNDYLFENYKPLNSSFVKNNSISNNFQYVEKTYAGYVNYSKAFEKININLGARLEKTVLKGENNEGFKLQREYFNIFPNISFDYKHNDTHDFQLNFSRRIDRPSLYDLNPFKHYYDQYNYEQGNQYLMPDYIYRGELAYIHNSGLSASLAYSNIQQIILPYTSQDDNTKIMFQSSKNMKSMSSFEYSIFYEAAISNKWNLTVDGFFSQMKYVGEIDGNNFQRSSISYSGSINNNIIIAKNTTLEISGIYIGPTIYGVIEVKSRWMSSFGIKTSLLDKKLDVTFGMDDIFHTMIGRSRTNFENQNWTFRSSQDTQRFRIALNYKFGKIKIDEREIIPSDEDEKNRLSH